MSQSTAASPGIVGRLRDGADLVVSSLLLAWGLLVHAALGRTPNLSYHAMRRLHGLTGGRINRAWMRWAARRRPAPPVSPVRGFCGELSAERIEGIVAALRRDGYAPMGRLLPPEVCDELERFARSAPCRAMGDSTSAPYPGEAAKALRYDFAENEILASPTACRIALDGTLAAIAQAYFRSRPRYDFTAMWWTTRHGPRDLSKAAQMYHYDMDRPFFLKFFFYLTDVSPANGPHVFVPGSHVRKPHHLSAPRRLSDDEVEQAYGPGGILTICGPRGTAFAVDTSAFHKGLPVVEGERLALQVEFTISDFGQSYPAATVRRSVLRQAGVDDPAAAGFHGNLVED
jgi:hypothetical protein